MINLARVASIPRQGQKPALHWKKLTWEARKGEHCAEAPYSRCLTVKLRRPNGRGRQKREVWVCFWGRQGNIGPTMGKSDSSQEQDMGVYGSRVENFSTDKCFHFLSQQPQLFMKPRWSQEIFRLLRTKNFRVIPVILWSGYGMSRLWEGERRELLIEWIHKMI